MTCKCGKPLAQREIATKTKEINGDVVIVESKTAQVCDKCGVIAFGPIPFQGLWPTIQPVVPWTPYRPYWGTGTGTYVQPNSASIQRATWTSTSAQSNNLQ